MSNKCFYILLFLIMIILLTIKCYIHYKKNYECFNDIRSKNNLNDLDYLFDFKEFKKNMTEKCNDINNRQIELNKLMNDECNKNNINSDLKCRTLEENNIYLNENKNNYCKFSDKQIEGFSNDNYYHHYN